MRYIADGRGYLKEVSFGADISCNGKVCTLYTGEIPSGYSSLMDWFTAECDNLHRWHIVDGQLTIDDAAADPPLPVPVLPISMTKVWENENSERAITTDTLEVDLKGFQMVAIEYRFKNTSSRMKMAFGVIGSQVVLDVISKSFYLGTRVCVPYQDHVDIWAAEYNAGGSTDPAEYMIPTRIFGINGIEGLQAASASAVCGTFLCGEVVAGQ